MNQKSVWNEKWIRLVAVPAAVWFFFRYLFPLAAPFIFAFLIITLCYPALERIQKHIPVKKKFLAAGMVLPLVLAAAGLLWAGLALCGRQLEGAPDFFTHAGRQFAVFFHRCCCSLDGKFGWNGRQIEDYVIARTDAMMENMQDQVMPRLLASSYLCLKGIFTAAGFLAVTCIAAVLLEKEYAGIMTRLKESGELRPVCQAAEGVASYLASYLRAQGVLMLTVSLLCSVTLGVLGIPGGVLLGILAGFLDMLPLIGTGIVLVPLAVWQLLNGHYMRMAACLLLYGVCAVTRQFLEPKLIGHRLGVAPFYMLLAIYAGVKLFGIAGIIKGPLALIVTVEIFRALDHKDRDVKRERNG